METDVEGAMPPSNMLENVEIATEFLATLFEEEDQILFRPIETWTEDGRKRSQVDYQRNWYRLAKPEDLKTTVLLLLKSAEAKRTNLFFGVCPRFGGDQKYDLAWQIRTVRTLWADIDYASVEEFRERLDEAGLPEPSIILNSGNGIHAYWLLDEPYLLDDLGDPPPILNEWPEDSSEQKAPPRKYFMQGDEKIYLDERRRLPRLSPKAQHLEGIVAGIADAVGGDHTTDLSRLMRLPGTFNRKDQRNGQKPIPTELIQCDSSRRYSLATFELFKKKSAAAERAEKIASMPLPRPRKISASKADKMNDLIAASSLAQTGGRSEADFAVCCFAVRNGVDKNELWRQVESVGKFAEGGVRYFETTWENAEDHVRTQKYEKLNGGSDRKADEEEFSFASLGDDAQPTIRVDPEITPVAVTMGQITDRILKVGGCYVRVDQLVVIRGGEIIPILSSAELSGFLNQHVEFLWVDEKRSQYKPLSTSYGNTWLYHPGERERLPAIELFTRNPVYSRDWRLVPPGYDPQSKIYYAGPPVGPLEGTHHINSLLRDFCFKAIADRTNYLGILLTSLLTPHFIGSKPAVLFNGNQPGLGKTVLGQNISILRDGQSVETASFNPNDEEFEKRLGAIVRRGASVVIVDNAKGKGRNPRIESACLERSITDPILSYRLLGKSESIRAENSHQFCLTANSPDVSRDLVTRSVVVNLFYEGNPERRTFSIADPEGYAQEHRLEILGELIGMVEHWKASGMPRAKTDSRFNKRGWGDIVGGILEANGEPDFLANSEEAATQLDDTRREFSDLVVLMSENDRGYWTATELVEHCGQHKLLQEELGDGAPRSKTTKLGTLAGRFVDETFDLGDGRTATFLRSKDRNGHTYRVGLSGEVRNL